MHPETAGPRGIAGWLILPALGLIIGPFFWAVCLVSDLHSLLADGMWSILTDRGAPLYQPLWPVTLAFEILIIFALLAFNVHILFRFFQHSRRLPGLMVLFYLTIMLFSWCSLVLWDLPSMTGHLDIEALGAIRRDALRNTFAVLIWVPYFTFSKRVRATFTK